MFKKTRKIIVLILVGCFIGSSVPDLNSWFDSDHIRNVNGFSRRNWGIDHAMGASAPGGIDLNSSNLAMMIKRDGRGVVLLVAQQDLAQFSKIEGLDPIILSITPARQTAVFSKFIF